MVVRIHRDAWISRVEHYVLAGAQINQLSDRRYNVFPSAITGAAVDCRDGCNLSGAQLSQTLITIETETSSISLSIRQPQKVGPGATDQTFLNLVLGNSSRRTADCGIAWPYASGD